MHISRLLVALSLLCVLGTGCATDAAGRAYARRSAFNLGLADVIVVRQAGKVPDSTYPTLVALAETTVPFLDEMDRAAILGIAPDFETAYLNAGIRVHDFLLRAALGVPATPGGPPPLPPPEPTTVPAVDNPAIRAAQRETQRLMDLARSLL